MYDIDVLTNCKKKHYVKVNYSILFFLNKIVYSIVFWVNLLRLFTENVSETRLLFSLGLQNFIKNYIILDIYLITTHRIRDNFS